MGLLSASQLAILKADIATSEFNVLPKNDDSSFVIAAAYNLDAAIDFWAWRTSVSQLELVTVTSVDGTTFSWPQFIARSQGERDGWREMFADGGRVNASLANVRQGFQDIFSGATAAPVAQRLHLATMARRKTSRFEKLFATGTGTTATPGTMIVEGPLGYLEVSTARNLP